jgi:hypothetical protein
VSDRRTFLSTLALSLAGTVRPGVRSTSAPAVTARTTVFYTHSAVSASLVRFSATGIDAAAGRLRVFGTGRNLLGTAGLLQADGGLYGELWLPLGGPLSVRSELEAPGLRSVLRTTHRLVPKPRWTVLWVNAADPHDLKDRFDRLSDAERAVQAAQWREAGVSSNPMIDPRRLHVMDHVQFLRDGSVARSLEEAYGIPLARVGVSVDFAAYPHTLPMALNGTGVEFAVSTGDPMGGPVWWEGPGASRVLVVPQSPGGHVVPIGLSSSIGDAITQIELWLEGLGNQDSARDRTALVASTGLSERAGRIVTLAREWSRRFAHPRIVTGTGDDALALLREARSTARPTMSFDASPMALPSVATLTELARERAAAADRRARDTMAPLARLLDPELSDDPLEVMADEIETAFPGHLVINASPFRRSDTVVLPSGRTEFVTDVPALGYAFVIEQSESAADAPSTRSSSPSVVSTDTYRLEIDRKTGSIRSLQSPDGHEWVGGEGLNTIRGSILEDLTVEDLGALGVRLTAIRWSSDLAQFRSTITAYHSLPWIDIENQIDGSTLEPIEVFLPFDSAESTVSWEVPGGHTTTAAPVRRAAHLRWIALVADARTAIIRALDAPFFDVRRDGTIVSHTPPGRSRIRVRAANSPMFTEDCARFGWGTEPLTVVPVAARPEGRLPRFGSLVVLDQPDAAVLGLEPAQEGRGAVVYVQDLRGEQRMLTLGHGLIAFDDARQVDYLERDLGRPGTAVPDGVAIECPAWGVTALRLAGLQLREG